MSVPSMPNQQLLMMRECLDLYQKKHCCAF